MPKFQRCRKAHSFQAFEDINPKFEWDSCKIESRFCQNFTSLSSYNTVQDISRQRATWAENGENLFSSEVSTVILMRCRCFPYNMHIEGASLIRCYDIAYTCAKQSMRLVHVYAKFYTLLSSTMGQNTGTTNRGV